MGQSLFKPINFKRSTLNIDCCYYLVVVHSNETDQVDGSKFSVFRRCCCFWCCQEPSEEYYCDETNN